MSKKIKILALSGIRSEYDILFPVIDKLRQNSIFDVKLVLSSAHLTSKHGDSINRIEEDGFQIVDKIDCLFVTDRNIQRSKGVGLLIYSLSQTIERENPDFIIVVGDREESIAAAIVGNYMNKLVVHLAGGDPVYGNADDPIRFAVSKLSHIHLTFAQQYSENLIKIGEEEFRVFNVGNPSYTNIKNIPDVSIDEIRKFLDFDVKKNNYIVFLKHPLSSEETEARFQMKSALVAVKEFAKEKNLKVIGIHPNSDPGSNKMLEIINDFEDGETVKFYKTLPRKIFINVIRNALILVGNSSMGILEAPFYKLPVVNIGNRQKGRLNAGNVKFVDYKLENIKEALYEMCFNNSIRKKVKELKNPFGDGNTPERIEKILLSINLSDEKWFVKRKLC